MNAPMDITEEIVINPAVAYTDDEWDKLDSDLRGELETQYILSMPGMKEKLDRACHHQKQQSLFQTKELEYLLEHPELVMQIKQLIEAHQQHL
jgi:hypothetical protein